MKLTVKLTNIGLTFNTGAGSEFVKRLSYKPGTRFSLIAGSGSYRSLGIEMDTLNSGDPTQTALIAHQFTLPPEWDAMVERDKLAFVWGCVLLLERHEAGEWLRVDGERACEVPHGYGVDPYSITLKER